MSGRYYTSKDDLSRPGAGYTLYSVGEKLNRLTKLLTASLPVVLPHVVLNVPAIRRLGQKNRPSQRRQRWCAALHAVWLSAAA